MKKERRIERQKDKKDKKKDKKKDSRAGARPRVGGRGRDHNSAEARKHQRSLKSQWLPGKPLSEKCLLYLSIAWVGEGGEGLKLAQMDWGTSIKKACGKKVRRSTCMTKWWEGVKSKLGISHTEGALFINKGLPSPSSLLISSPS